MAYTRKQVVTCISIVFLIVVTAVAGYASSRADSLSLPIPRTLTGFTTALPIVAGLLLEGGYDFTRFQERRRRQPPRSTERAPAVIVANTLIFIYSTVVVTLLGTYAAPPSELDCGLRNRWQAMFRHKDVAGVRAIQDTFNCCGYANTRDMAWPFPDKSHTPTACESAFGRTSSCMGAWKSEEQKMAGLLMGMVGLVFLWQFTIIIVPTKRESWLHSVAPDAISRMIADERNGGNDTPRQAIDYLPNFNRFSDRVQEEETDEEAADSAGNGARRALEDSSPPAKNNDAEHQPSVENAWARN